MYGHSGIMSFYHKGGLEESKKFLQELKMITLAESLGGYESLAELPYLVTLYDLYVPKAGFSPDQTELRWSYLA